MLSTRSRRHLRVYLASNEVGDEISDALDYLLTIADTVLTQAVIVESSPYTVSTTDSLLVLTGGGYTVRLPPANTYEKVALIVKDISGVANGQPHTIVADGSDVIDGSSVRQISSNYASITLRVLNNVWYIV